MRFVELLPAAFYRYFSFVEDILPETTVPLIGQMGT